MVRAKDDSPAFVSYSRLDSEFVLRLAADLRAGGANVWLDQLDIEPGMPWDRAIEDALARSPSMLVILSAESVNSDNVRDEVNYALGKQKRIIPVLYNDCDQPFRLARLQHIDLRTDYSRGLKTLLKVLGVDHVPVAAAVPASTKPKRIEARPRLSRERRMPVPILPQIKHIIVVMLENRSFDNLCGWLYKPGSTPQPSQFLPGRSPQTYNGLKSSYTNPVSELYFTGQSTETYPVFDEANATNMPNPDPEEDFDDVNYQLFGPEPPSPTPKWPNLGFVINYAKVTGTNIPVQIMEPFSPAQLPVISALATNFAICDAWFSSVPSNTWPNRAFFHAGTSNGNVVNGTVPNPFNWNVRNIFNVLEDIGASWRVYHDTVFVPPLTWLMFPNLWLKLDHFSGFDRFKSDCAAGTLPQYSFVEPSFLDNPNDEHPPHDVVAGEQFLYDIWQAVNRSPAWSETLLMITYDEHGGIYDHVHPPYGAATPDAASNPGEEGFTFDRFGVRVPTVLISPWIQAGTVFRSPTATPYDHTSMLATLRDWLQIPADKMLTSARIAAAPTLEQVFTLPQARTDIPNIPQPVAEVKATATFKQPNPIQQSLVTAYATQQGKDPAAILSTIKTRQDAIDYFQSNPAPTPPPTS